MPEFDVVYAVYGALADGDENAAQAFNVTWTLSSILNAPGSTGIVQVGNAIFDDPSYDDTKHFGALVNNRYFACQEGQTIDFLRGGGAAAGPGVATSPLVVRFAVYGALTYGVEAADRAFDVTALVQAMVNHSGGVVVCSNDSFGDPSAGDTKHFAAVVNRGGTDFYFACQEGQTINFGEGGGS